MSHIRNTTLRLRDTFSISPFLIIFCSCASVDPEKVRAKAGAPAAAEVQSIEIARDRRAPQFFLVIEPVRAFQEEYIAVESGQGAVNAKGTAGILGKFDIPIRGNYNEEKRTLTLSLLQRQVQITQQLTSALAGVGNFQLIDYGVFRYSPQKIQVPGRDRGPYLFRAVITEWGERTEDRSSTVRVPGFYKAKDEELVGVVGLDISVTDPKDGRIIAAFPVQGTYSKATAQRKTSVIFQPIISSQETQQSIVDQALRVALNQAATELHARTVAKEIP